MRVIGSHHRVGFVLVALVSLALGLGAVTPAHAQSLSTTSLTGAWSFFQLATPAGAFGNSSIRSYSGQITFAGDGTGADTAAPITDDLLNTFTITGGGLTVTAGGNVSGSLQFNNSGNNDFTISDARLLTNGHTIVGTATILGQVGMFNLIKLESSSQSFSLDTDLATSWNYFELTPSNDLARATTSASQGDAAWVKGSITFHATSGCTDAALTLPDGTNRSVISGSPGTNFG